MIWLLIGCYLLVQPIRSTFRTYVTSRLTRLKIHKFPPQVTTINCRFEGCGKAAVSRDPSASLDKAATTTILNCGLEVEVVAHHTPLTDNNGGTRAGNC